MHVHQHLAHAVLAADVRLEGERLLLQLQHTRSLPDPTPHPPPAHRPARNAIAAIPRLAPVGHVQSAVVHGEVVRVVVTHEERDDVAPTPHSLGPSPLLQEGVHDARVHAGAAGDLHLVARRVVVLGVTTRRRGCLPALHELLRGDVEERHGGQASTLLLFQLVAATTVPLHHGRLDAAETLRRVSHAPTVSGIEEPQVHRHSRRILGAIDGEHIVRLSPNRLHHKRYVR